MKLDLPERELKPRSKGLTSINDTRLTSLELSGILEDYSQFIDIAKIGIGEAAILPNLDKKISLYKKYNIEVYFGGTLFEKYYYQKKLDSYFEFLKSKEISTIEISTGTIDIPLEERLSIINSIKSEFTIISEVGSKDSANIMAPSVWIKEIQELMKAGSKYVITEGRDSGTSGIYRPSGELRDGLISDIINNTDVNRLIFETPTTKLQMHFINLVGPNVNVGNINPNDVMILETQRLGLRSETFYIK